MTIIYTDSALLRESYAAREPIADERIGDLIESLQLQWRRHGQQALSYFPISLFETSSTTYTRTNSYGLDYAEDLIAFPMFEPERIAYNASADRYEYTVEALMSNVAGTLTLKAELYDDSWTLIDDVEISVTSTTGTVTGDLIVPAATQYCNVVLSAKVSAGTGQIAYVNIQSKTTSEAPR